MDTYIFGVTPFAQMLCRYLESGAYQGERRHFAGFVCDDCYVAEAKVEAAPILSWTEFVAAVSPESCEVISSVAYGRMNGARAEVFKRLKAEGYALGTFVHESATIAEDCVMGEGNIILEHATIQPFVSLGDNNILWSNVNVCHHTTIGSFNFLAASSTVLGMVKIADRCFVGSGAVVRNKAVVGSGSLIGAMAFAEGDISAGSVVVPARSSVLELSASEIAGSI